MDEGIKLLARLLVDNGLEYAFGVTGSGSSLALITEMESLGVRYYPVSHEAAAALMAGAVCRSTGRVSASISIKGPGLANMLPGIAHNHFESRPALSISEAFGDEVPFYRKHKRLDPIALLSSVVKGVGSLSDLETRLPALLRASQAEVPGPVHMDLCVRDAQQTAMVACGKDHVLARSQDVKAGVFRQLRNSGRPVLMIGSLASRRTWREKLNSLKVPIFTTASAKGILDENRPHSAGVFTGEGKELAPESQLFAEADLVIGIGLRNTEVLSPRPFGKPTIIIDEVDGNLAGGFQASVLIGDADGNLISEVLDELESKSWDLERVISVKLRMQEELLGASWLPARCFDVLNRLPFPHALVLDTGSFCTVGEHLWRAGPGRLFVGSSNGRYMGTAIPSAVGLAISHPGLPLFCAVGDGGMGAYPAEIKLVVQERLPICFILMTEGRYASISSVPQPRPMSSRAVTVFQPSWWKSVEGMGCDACVVNSEETFVAVVQAWARRGPLFVESPFNPGPYAAMTRRLR